MRDKTIISSILMAICLLTCSYAYAHDYSKWIKHCEPYRNMVYEILDNEQVDRDFYYLMIAESQCTDKAHSHKGAQGFWQLMPATAKHYGCEQPHDLECATLAAAKYLKHLQEVFPTYNHVIAAYNMGGHNYKKKGISKEALDLVERVNTIKSQDNKAK